MGKEYKVLDQEGQKELLDSLQGIFNEFINNETQGVIDMSEFETLSDTGFGKPEKDIWLRLLRKSWRRILNRSNPQYITT